MNASKLSIAALLFAALLTGTTRLSAAPKPSVPVSQSPANLYLNAYNKALTDFGHATQTRDSAQITATLAELQALTKMPEYATDTAVHNSTVHNLIGYLYLTQNDPASAIPELQTTVQLNPSNLDARNNLGNALRQTGKYDAAAIQYQYILDHPAAANGPDPNRVKFNLATVQGQAGNLDQSLALFSGLTANGQGDAATYKNYGFFLQKAGHSADAAAALQKAASLDPQDASASLSAGELYAKSGQNDAAIASLTKAVGPDANPKLDAASEYDAYFALGEAYAAKGDSPEAIKEFGTAATLQPQNAMPLYNKGVLEEQSGLTGDAEASYRSALQKDPASTQAQVALGLLLAGRGSNAEATTLLSQAAPNLPQDAKAAPVYSRLGDLYARQNNSAAANAAWLQAITLNPADADSRVALASSYMSQRQYVSALRQYNAAAQTRPADAAIQNQRGVAYKNLKQYPKALAAFKEAAVLKPSSAQIQNNIGVLYELLGKKPLAIVAYKKALALNPQLAEARQNLNRFASK